ncbi:MAG: hypothetical protein GEV10_19910 [Streptosporangiales bacterium]|nr:hypothetical protein [Streptosporangiales bacterium]
MTRWRTWRAATADALYGPAGFYRGPTGPAGQFRTSVHASDLFAAALARLAETRGLRTLVDVGAGRGELAAACARVASDLEVVSVEIAHPSFATEIPDGVEALVVANEWLDDVPLDVAELTPAGPRLVEVDDTGRERLGEPPDAEDAAWLDAWWPLAGVGDRAEIGRTRDDAWAAAVGRVRRGLAVAIDYGHDLASRPPRGTLTGYRDGRQVPPVPDGTCDVTAHVAIDSCAAAGRRAGAGATVLTTQRAALTALGVDGRPPPHATASSDPAGYLRALGRASEAAELTDRQGLGAFRWLVQDVGTDIPTALG